MIIEKIFLDVSAGPDYAGALAFEPIYALLGGLKVGNILCVNPRDGKMPRSCLPVGASIDSFVSDPEWRGAAETFSANIYAGASHHPLLPISSEKYDLVWVCEDFALVDDCDAMAVQYYRLLQPGGILLCAIWNMSCHEHIGRLLLGQGIPPHSYDSLPRGRALIPLDNLVARFKELGFLRTTIFIFKRSGDDVEQYVQVSRRQPTPMSAWHFLSKYFVLAAQK
jgi:hypothetical protein